VLCILIRKASKLSFSIEASWRTTSKLQLIPMYVCDLMSTLSLNENRYFLLFVDDFIRMSSIFFSKAKVRGVCCQIQEKRSLKMIDLAKMQNRLHMLLLLLISLTMTLNFFFWYFQLEHVSNKCIDVKSFFFFFLNTISHMFVIM